MPGTLEKIDPFRIGTPKLWIGKICLVGRLFCFDDDTDRAGSICAIVNDKIVSHFGIDEVIGFVVGFLQKVRNQILMKFFRFGLIGSVKKLNKIGFETFAFNPVGFLLLKMP